jgi:hypothetical protein
MALPPVDFDAITGVARAAIALYGSTVTFTEQGAVSGRPVRTVIYRDINPEALLQDLNSEAAKALLSPDDFAAPNRFPQQFDTLTVGLDGFARIYTILEVHPVLAEDRLPLLIASIRGN